MVLKRQSGSKIVVTRVYWPSWNRENAEFPKNVQFWDHFPIGHGPTSYSNPGWSYIHYGSQGTHPMCVPSSNLQSSQFWSDPKAIPTCAVSSSLGISNQQKTKQPKSITKSIKVSNIPSLQRAACTWPFKIPMVAGTTPFSRSTACEFESRCGSWFIDRLVL